jgi:hypothetical protein
LAVLDETTGLVGALESSIVGVTAASTDVSDAAAINVFVAFTVVWDDASVQNVVAAVPLARSATAAKASTASFLGSNVDASAVAENASTVRGAALNTPPTFSVATVVNGREFGDMALINACDVAGTHAVVAGADDWCGCASTAAVAVVDEDDDIAQGSRARFHPRRAAATVTMSSVAWLGDGTSFAGSSGRDLYAAQWSCLVGSSDVVGGSGMRPLRLVSSFPELINAVSALPPQLSAGGAPGPPSRNGGQSPLPATGMHTPAVGMGPSLAACSCVVAVGRSLHLMSV